MENTMIIDEVQAEAIFLAPDSNDTPTVRIRSAYRNLSCSGSGPEAYRRIRLPGSTVCGWPDAEPLPRCDGLASTRRASVSCTVPVGTVVAEYSRQVYKGSRGRYSVAFAIVIRGEDGKAKLHWLEHRTLRTRRVYEITLPSGRKFDFARREL